MAKKVVFNRTVDTFILDTCICVDDVTESIYKTTMQEPEFIETCKAIIASQSELVLFDTKTLVGFIRAIESNSFGRVSVDHAAGYREHLFVSISSKHLVTLMHHPNDLELDDFNNDKVSDLTVTFKLKLYYDKATNKAGIEKTKGLSSIAWRDI